jgi:hypothetical protein
MIAKCYAKIVFSLGISKKKATFAAKKERLYLAGAGFCSKSGYF